MPSKRKKEKKRKEEEEEKKMDHPVYAILFAQSQQGMTKYLHALDV